MSIISLSIQSQSSLMVINMNGMMHTLCLPIAIMLHHQWITLSLYSILYLDESLERRLSNLQNYCRYMGDQSGRLVVEELQRTWKLHAKLLTENRSTKPAISKRVTRASDLKIGQLVLIKNHQKSPFDLTYIN